MQRWIVGALIAGFMALAAIGTGVWFYRQNLPDKMWVQLPLNPKVTAEQQQTIISDIRKKLLSSDALITVSNDLGLARKWKLASTEDAALELEKRLFIEPSEVELPTGPCPSINLGLKGKRKERAVLGDASMGLMKEVWKILGIKPASAEDI